MRHKPKCIAVTGRPGSGKSTLAKRLGAMLRMPVVSRDEIKEGYVNTVGVRHSQLPPETNGIVTNLFFEIVNRYLAGGVSVVIEAAFQHKVWQPRIASIAQISEPFIIVCSIDGALAAQRHLARAQIDSSREYFHGDKSVALPFDYVAPNCDVHTISVATDGEYVPSLEEIVRQIGVQNYERDSGR